MQQRLREAQLDSLFRSVGRENGDGSRPGLVRRLFSRRGLRLRRGHASVDFRDTGEDVWRAMRDI